MTMLYWDVLMLCWDVLFMVFILLTTLYWDVSILFLLMLVDGSIYLVYIYFLSTLITNDFDFIEIFIKKNQI